ncbi:hypothetical protein AAEO57_06510 [Flavobacterium sp. DGU38]|uniref:DUF2892 domain-containing protein n=1 Tax=Flavobacterium calami TaxID=3139144 RepID=A0ABU9INY6_9FLAO
MEKLINQENFENIKETIENKISGISANHLLCAGLGTLALSSGLKLAGKKQAASLVGKLFITLVAIGLYKKYKDSSDSKPETKLENSETYE